MFAEWCRKVFGGVRLGLTVMFLLFCVLVIVADLSPKIEVPGGVYTLIAGIMVQLTVFVWKETDRPTGGNSNETNP